MKIRFLPLLICFLFLSAFRQDNPVVSIFMIGDSTMADKPVDGGNPERGWGQMLPRLLNENIRVRNHAVNGRSSKSFIDEGRWEVILPQLRKGDYVFIQFGHNDEKADTARYTEPGGTFDGNLRRYVREAKEKGAVPVLFNSIVRRNFNEKGVLIDTHGAYLESPRKVAEEMGVAFIDMNRLTHELVQEMGAETSKNLFMWVEPNTVPAVPQGKQDDTHLNVRGGRVVAELALDAIAGELPELAKYLREKYDYVVAKDGSGDFFTVQEAINKVPDYRKGKRTTILIRKGEYKEKLVVPECKINLSLVGEDGVTLTYDTYANRKNLFGENMGTSGSSACYIYAPDFYAENITFANSSGPVGQAVSCFVSGDRAYFKNCRFLGFQDTLYTYGKESRQYYEECYIEGTVDFIFGWSTALFNRCVIHSKADGYVTAPSTDEGKTFGYVFHDCRLTANEGVDKVYLSRPWRPYARAVFIRCDLGSHILPQGWNNWNKKEAEKTVFYAEYESRGAGANPKARAAFSRQLKSSKGYEPESVLLGTDGWNPVKDGNKLIEVYR